MTPSLLGPGAGAGDGCVDSVLMCEGDVLVLITGDRLGS